MSEGSFGTAGQMVKQLNNMGSQHPSPNVKLFCKFEPQIWLEIITSRDAKSACFKGSRTSCREIVFGIFWPNFGQKRSHHVMDASSKCYMLQCGRAESGLRLSRCSDQQQRLLLLLGAQTGARWSPSGNHRWGCSLQAVRKRNKHTKKYPGAKE